MIYPLARANQLLNNWDQNCTRTDGCPPQMISFLLEKVDCLMGKNEEQLPQPTVGRLLADCHLPPFTKIFCQQSADCWPFVGRLSADCWQHVGNLLAKCRPTVGRQSADWLRAPVKYQKSLSSQGKNIAYRREMKLSHLSPPYCLCFLGTNLLAISYVQVF